MEKRTIITWVILLLFTVTVGIISGMPSKFTVTAILILSALKFMGVALQFMDLKIAHNFWKIGLTTFLMIFIGIILIII